jgi:hypothetical protein
MGHFVKILVCNLMRYCICSPYCWPYVLFEHPGHTYGGFGSISQNRGVTKTGDGKAGHH